MFNHYGTTPNKVRGMLRQRREPPGGVVVREGAEPVRVRRTVRAQVQRPRLLLLPPRQWGACVRCALLACLALRACVPCLACLLACLASLARMPCLACLALPRLLACFVSLACLRALPRLRVAVVVVVVRSFVRACVRSCCWCCLRLGGITRRGFNGILLHRRAGAQRTRHTEKLSSAVIARTPSGARTVEATTP